MSRTLRSILLISQAAVVTAACNHIASAVPEGVAAPYRGTVRPSCAPHDAPSVELRLESAVGPETVSFNLWPGTQVRRPTTVHFDAAHPIGMATYCIAGGECEQAEWGEVRLTTSEDRGLVTGRWVIGLAGGRRQHGTFEAELLAIQAYCG